MTIATIVRDFISGVSGAWWNSCRLLIFPPVPCGLFVYGVSIRMLRRVFRRVYFYSMLRASGLVVFGDPVARRNLFQSGPIAGLILAGFEKNQMRARIERRGQVAS